MLSVLPVTLLYEDNIVCGLPYFTLLLLSTLPYGIPLSQCVIPVLFVIRAALHGNSQGNTEQGETVKHIL